MGRHLLQTCKYAAQIKGSLSQQMLRNALGSPYQVPRVCCSTWTHMHVIASGSHPIPELPASLGPPQLRRGKLEIQHLSGAS